MSEKTVYTILSKIQTELKAPKNQYNSFGDYNYRNCEDILEGVKPLLDGATLRISDDIVLVGDRYYVKATAALSYNGMTEFTTAFAREAQAQKGMGDSQITGSTSSYARKYALNGLFAIDDTKDADNDDNRKEGVTPKQQPQNPSQPTVEPSSRYSAKPKVGNCSDCNAPITEKVKAFSESKHGRALCMDCQKK